jgi:hypothetical protein
MMDFSQLDSLIQYEIMDLLNSHIKATVSILEKDRYLMPMMILDSNQLISLQSQDGSTDVDRAYAFVVEKLKNESFDHAVFSYSTKVCISEGSLTDVIKTYVFLSNGLEVSFYTPYTVKGVFKKKVSVGNTLLIEVKENVLL